MAGKKENSKESDKTNGIKRNSRPKKKTEENIFITISTIKHVDSKLNIT